MRQKRFSDWVLSCGHTRSMDDSDGQNEAGDTARCYECPATGNHRIGFTAPMRRLKERA